MVDKISVKIHESYRKVVAICDAQILGKRFEEGIKQLDLRESFYKDKFMTKEEIVLLIKKMRREDATFNIVGSLSVQAAVEAGVIREDEIGYIDGVSFALVLL